MIFLTNYFMICGIFGSVEEANYSIDEIHEDVREYNRKTRTWLMLVH